MGFILKIIVTPPTANVKVELYTAYDMLSTNYTDPEGVFIANLASTYYPVHIKAVLPDYGLESEFVECYDQENYEVTFDLAPIPLEEKISWKPLAGIGAAAAVFFNKVFRRKR